MNITARQSKIKTLRQGDPRFMMQDTFVMVPRAGFEINEHCPKEYRSIISECIRNGWLKPIAHVYSKELTMDALR